MDLEWLRVRESSCQVPQLPEASGLGNLTSGESGSVKSDVFGKLPDVDLATHSERLNASFG